MDWLVIFDVHLGSDECLGSDEDTSRKVVVIVLRAVGYFGHFGGGVGVCGGTTLYDFNLQLYSSTKYVNIIEEDTRIMLFRWTIDSMIL